MPQHSSQNAKANEAGDGRPAARGAPGRAAAPATSGSPMRRITAPVARPIARHGDSSRKTSPSSSDSDRDADPEADVDERRQQVVALDVGPGEAGVDAGDEQRDAERAEQRPRAHRGSGSHGALAAGLAGAGCASPRASATNETTSTSAAAAPNSVSGDRQVGAADDAVGEERRALRVDAQLDDLRGGVLELDLDDAGDRRREGDARLPARLEIGELVVGVDVDVLGDVGDHVEAHPVALVDADLLDAADDLAALVADQRHRAQGSACGLGVACAGAPPPARWRRAWPRPPRSGSSSPPEVARMTTTATTAMTAGDGEVDEALTATHAAPS